MISSWASWLPDNTAVPAAAQGILEERIERWAREWFAGSPACVVGRLARGIGRRPELRTMVRCRCGEGLEIALAAPATVMLGALVLDVSTATGSRNGDDLQLLEAVGTDCLESLKHHLSTLFGLGRLQWVPSDAVHSDGAYCLEIGLAGRAVTILVYLQANRFAELVRSTLPPPVVEEPLGIGSDALAKTPITLFAALGGCNLGLAELAGLSIDDVIVLDSVLSEPCPLAVDRAVLAKGACAVVQAHQGIALKIVQAPSK